MEHPSGMRPQVCGGNQNEIVMSTVLTLACTSGGRGAADSMYIPHCFAAYFGMRLHSRRDRGEILLSCLDRPGHHLAVCP